VRAGNVWDGGGSFQRWSDRFNWSDDQLPSNSGSLTFPTGNGSVQDLFTAPSGVPDSSFSLIELLNGHGVSAQSPGHGLGIVADGRIVGQGQLRLPLITSGALRIEASTSSGLIIDSIVQRSGAITDLYVGGDADHGGQLLLFGPSYAGRTTISRGKVYLGSLGAYVSTHDQGDYTIAPGASLFANGTIGLAANGRVENAGTIGMSGDGPDRSLAILGDLRMAAGSTWLANVSWAPNNEPLGEPPHVTGTLDLSATSDTLKFDFIFPFPAGQSSYVLARYGSRVGEFDAVLDLRPEFSVVYTSAPNAGPGEIVLRVVPEPVMAHCLFPAIVITLRRRRRTSEEYSGQSALTCRSRW
jgi:hypothetical protein